MIIRRFLQAAVVLAASASAHAQSDVHRVGAGANCDFASVQSALAQAQAAPGPSRILIAHNRTYTEQHLTISDEHPVELAGGYGDCLDEAAEGRTVLDGSGGSAVSVISVFGNGDVTLRQLVITGADVGSGVGGGIKLSGDAELTLIDTRVRLNRALRGGGIHAIAIPSQTRQRIVLGPGAEISSNFAALGAGVFLTHARLAGEHGAITQNVASDSGGGIYATDGATVQLDRALISGNEAALDGGGIYARGGSTVQVFVDGPGRAAIVANLASRHGGGAYVLADGVDQVTRLDLWGVDLEFNRARSGGGGVFLKESRPASTGATARAHFTVNTVPPAPDAPLRRSRLEGNAATDDFANPFGSVFVIEAGSGRASMRLFRADIATNIGTSVFRLTGRNAATGAELELADSSLRDNRSTSLVTSMQGRSIDIDRVSVAGNLLLGPALFDLDDVALSLARSILHQPGSVVLRDSAQTVVAAEALLVHETISLPPQTDIVQGDPAFVRVATAGGQSSDLHLRADSLALDFAPDPFLNSALAQDLDLQPRVVDLAALSDEFGPLDLGAFERQSDPLFADGFEAPPPSR